MGGNILKIFLAAAGIAVVVYTVKNWNYYADHMVPAIVIVAAVIATIWNLVALKR